MDSNYCLYLEPYCENCPEFKVSVSENSMWFEDDYESGKIITRTITCEHQRKCKNLVSFIKRSIEKEQKNAKGKTDY